MKIPLFSAFWCLLRAVENTDLAAGALVLADTARHAHNAPAWRSEAARCLRRARVWISKWQRELRDPIPA